MLEILDQMGSPENVRPYVDKCLKNRHKIMGYLVWVLLVPSQLRLLKCLLLYMHSESGLIFVLAMGIVLSPLVYSLLSQFQVNLKPENSEEGEGAAQK